MSQQAVNLIAENIRTQNPVLDLGNCGLTELSPELLAALAKTGEWLEELIWSSDWWDWKTGRRLYSQNRGDANTIQHLPALPPTLRKLTKLVANGLGLSDCTPLAALKQLTQLDISHNQIADCTPLAALKQLTQLEISNNQIADCAPLAQLQRLTALDISLNQIADCAPLAQLQRLTELKISGNQIADCAPLAQLQRLTILNISDNQIADCAPLAQLQRLTELDISGNPIADCAPLAQLQQLTQLYISNNQIADCAPLAQLQRLTELNIFNNPIADCAPLAQLQRLTRLHISYNRIADCAPLAQLQRLTELYISGNPIADCAPLAQLQRLTILYISDNQIADCAPLAQLQRLTELKISGNQIADCAPLAQLQRLTILNISDNRIADCAPLAQLQRLTRLDISRNQIADCAPLAQLQRLTELYISDNPIADCAPLAQLQRLTELSISNNQIADCAPLAQLQRLTILKIFNNQIADCAPLAQLQRLTRLDISRNQIADCAPLAQLQRLTELDISGNLIALLPFSLLDAWPQLQALYLGGNPLQNIDRAVYDERYTNVLPKVKDFIKDLRQGSTSVYASKLVLVGNGRVGKTCLVKRWLDDTFNEKEDSTHAIQLRQHPLGKLAQAMGLESLPLNIWDFGGQDIYHATHQVFLRTNALFLLVWDAETEAQAQQTETLPDGHTITYTNHPLRYWLSYIKTLSNNSPVLLVQTKAGGQLAKPSNPPGITTADWAAFNIRGALAVDSNRSVANGFGCLVEKIELLVQEQVQGQCTQLPTTWYKVRQAIEANLGEKIKRMSLAAFKKLCKDNWLDESSTDTLLQYLHDTGTLFYREGLFDNQLVIDQQWAIDAVYALFDRRKHFFRAFRDKGFFEGQDLQHHWQGYTEAEQQLFVSFMQSCKICVEIDPSQYHEPEKPFAHRTFLAPQLLPADGEAKKDMAFDGANGPCLIYQASLLHPAVIQEIIVQLAFLSNRYEMWANGIIIKTNKGKALIEAQEGHNQLRVQLYEAGQLDLLETLQQVISKKVEYDAELETRVSLDGVNYVNLQTLKKQPAGNALVATEDNMWVDAAPYRRFLPTANQEPPEKEEGNAWAHLQPAEKAKAAVFFSYAWKDAANSEREKAVDAFFETLSKDMQGQIVIHRDKKDVQYGDSINDYMKRIGRGRHIFVFLSDKYLRSPYCMYELHLAYGANCSDTRLLKEVIYPVRIENLHLDKPATRKVYADFWDGEIAALDTYVAEDPTNRTDSAEELKKIRRIREDLDRLLLFLNQICTPDTAELSANGFEKVKDAIQRRLQQSAAKP